MAETCVLCMYFNSMYMQLMQETAPNNFTTSEPDYTELDGNDTSTSGDATQTPASDNATIAVSTYNSIVTEGGSTSSMDFGTVRDNNGPSTVGAIVGGVIGGVVALTLLVVIIAALVIRKKRKTRKPGQAHCSSDYYRRLQNVCNRKVKSEKATAFLIWMILLVRLTTISEQSEPRFCFSVAYILQSPVPVQLCIWTR